MHHVSASLNIRYLSESGSPPRLRQSPPESRAPRTELAGQRAGRPPRPAERWLKWACSKSGWSLVTQPLECADALIKPSPAEMAMPRDGRSR